MKKVILLTFATICLLPIARAQTTTLYSDDFSSGSGGWSLGSAGNGDAWIVNQVYTCSTNTPNNGGGNYLHIFSGVNDSCDVSNGGFGDWICYATMTSGISTVGYSAVNISFSWLCYGQGFGFYNDGTVDFSVDGGQTWTNITNPVAQYRDQSSWTSTTISSSNYSTMINQSDLRIRFGWTNTGAGLDPAFAVDNVLITATGGGVTCTNTGGNASPANDTVCSGQTITLNLSGSVGVIQWEQSINGTSWTNITGATGTSITSLPPSSLVYYEALVSQSGCPTQYSTVDTVVVNPLVTPTIAITSSPPSDTVCAGQQINFTATTNTNAQFKWFVNNIDQSNSTDAFSSSILKNGDIISAEAISNAACVTTNDTSASITITVNPTDTATVNILQTPPSPICEGGMVTFTAVPANGGTAPSFQWYINGSKVSQGNDSIYVSSTLNNNDVVTCSLISNAACVAMSRATANDTLEVSVCTNVNSLAGNKSYIISPNPTDGIFSFFSNEKISSLDVFDIEGKLISQSFPESSGNITADISNHSKGMYFVRIITSKGIVNTKLILE